MIASRQHRFIFIKTKKTAGTSIPEKRGRFAKLFAQEQEALGINRTVIVELGQGGNCVSVQSADEP